MKVKEIIKATGGRFVKGDLESQIDSFSIDSRTIKKNDLFIAVKGKRFDGHDFLEEVIKKGASGVIVSRNSLPITYNSPLIIRVKDTIKALGAIAKYYRVYSGATVIAITGSNGKTTAKDMITSILNKKVKVLGTEGTENNNIGLPLTLLRLRDEKVCVLELGMNHFGEIDYLARIAMPQVGLITNIGPSHLLGVRDERGVFKAKKELLKYVEKDLILNGDDPYLSKVKKESLRITRFGLGEDNDIRAASVAYENGGWNFYVNGKYEIRLNLEGQHNVYNALAAISVAEIFGVKKEDIQESLENFKSPYRRLNLKEVDGICLVDDTYNSNPLSLKNAIEFLANYKTHGKKILVSGDMLELGRMSRYYHEAIADMVKDFGIDMLITVGKYSYNAYLVAKKNGMKDKNALWHFDKPQEAGMLLKELTNKGDIVLIKGSRGMMMEEAIKCFITSSTR